MYILMYISAMLQRYSIAEARARLPRMIDEVEAGVKVELTRRGRPVAVLISCQEFDRLQGKRSYFAETYRNFLEKYSLEEIGLEHDFSLTTRDKAIGRKVSL